MDLLHSLDAYPASPTPYRYVNSGVWMGRDDNNAKFDEIVASFTAQVEAATVSDTVDVMDA